MISLVSAIWRTLACNRLVTARVAHEILCTPIISRSPYIREFMYMYRRAERYMQCNITVHTFRNRDIHGNTCAQFVLVSRYTKMHVHRRQSAEYTENHVYIWPTSVYMKTHVHISTHICTWKIRYSLRRDNQHTCHDPKIVGAFYGN
jgi:hypothetical protein